jgi:DtxR family manganese transport transcriptional regulator
MPSRTRTANPPAAPDAAPPRRRKAATGLPTRPTRASHADGFAQTRKAHANELAEDYVEIIADLIDTTGEARVVDIAARLGVSHVTVIRTLARLQKIGLVTTRPYRSIFLTEEGRRLAAQSRQRHEIVLNFLLALGVPAAAANADAEGIEHHVSPPTLAAFERFTRARAGRR